MGDNGNGKEPIWRKQKPLSDEHKKKISYAMTGRPLLKMLGKL
jgi:hypothetical protein